MNNFLLILTWVIINLGFVFFIFRVYNTKLRQSIIEARKEKHKLIRLIRQLRKMQNE